MSSLILHLLVQLNVKSVQKMTSKVILSTLICSKLKVLFRRSLELSAFIRQTFEPVILTSQFPRSQIDIYLQIFQNDGGVLQCCINAATLALIDAGIPMMDYVCACSVGCIDKEPTLGEFFFLI
jgi:ribonuclease PH